MRLNSCYNKPLQGRSELMNASLGRHVELNIYIYISKYTRYNPNYPITCHKRIQGTLAEWFKAPGRGPGLFGGASSNLAGIIIFFVH